MCVPNSEDIVCPEARANIDTITRDQVCPDPRRIYPPWEVVCDLKHVVRDAVVKGSLINSAIYFFVLFDGATPLPTGERLAKSRRLLYALCLGPSPCPPTP